MARHEIIYIEVDMKTFAASLKKKKKKHLGLKIWKPTLIALGEINTFTFIHSANAFIQSDKWKVVQQ